MAAVASEHEEATERLDPHQLKCGLGELDFFIKREPFAEFCSRRRVVLKRWLTELVVVGNALVGC